MTTKAAPVEEKNGILEDRLYRLKAIDKKVELKLDSKSKIFLLIDDHETNIPVEKIFSGKIDYDSNSLEGYSILQLLNPESKLKIDSNTSLKIQFVDKSNGIRFYVDNIGRSFFPGYDDDIEITPKDRLAFVELLLNAKKTADTPVIDTEAIKKAEEEAKAKAEAEAKAAQEEADRKKAEEEATAKAQEEAKAAQEEADRIKAEEEQKAIEEANKKILGGPEWAAHRQDLLDDGFKEYRKYDYRFFHKDDKIDFFALEPGDFIPVELSEEDITDDKEIYSFEDADDDEWTLTFNKVEGKITIKESE